VATGPTTTTRARFTNDRRDYTYDARQNVINVRGQYYIAGGAITTWPARSTPRTAACFKSFYDETSTKMRAGSFTMTPSTGWRRFATRPTPRRTSTYSLFQLFWIGDRMTAYWQTDYPSVTTSKRFVGTDESGRIIDMWDWPVSGNAARVWTVNPDAWANDKNLSARRSTSRCCLRVSNQDTEAAAYENDGVTVHRPGLALNGFRTYDPFVGAYVQPSTLVGGTFTTYVYAQRLSTQNS